MLEIILVVLFTIFFAWVAWWKLDWAITLCILFLPTYLLRFQVGFLPMTILEVMILVIVVVWGIRTIKERLIKKACPAWLPWRWILLAWILVGVLSVVVSPDLRQALGLWKAYILEPVLFFIVFVNTIKTKHQVRSVVWALGSLTVIVGFVALVQYAGLLPIPSPYGTQVPMRATSVYPFPTAVGKLLGPLVALFLGLTLTGRRKENGQPSQGLWPYIFPWGVLVFGLMALVLSFSRGAIIAVFAAMIFLSFFSQWKRWLWILLIAVILLSLAVPFTRHELLSIISTKDTSADVHVVMWKGAIRIIKANPILGTGLASFPVVYEKYKEATHVEFFPNPDELYLTLWIEMGLTGLIVFIWIVIRSFRTVAALLKNPEYRNYTVGLMAALISLLVHGFFDTPYFKNDLAVAFWVLAGLVVVIRRYGSTNNEGSGIIKSVHINN